MWLVIQSILQPFTGKSSGQFTSENSNYMSLFMVYISLLDMINDNPLKME